MKKFPVILFIVMCASIFTQAQDISSRWSLEDCIDYAMQQNIQVQKSKIIEEENTENTKKAQAALFPNLSFSTSHNFNNRPYNNDAAAHTNSYNGNYGLNLLWTLYNGGKRQNTIQQQKLNTQIAGLNVTQTENDIKESITQSFIQILYANESVKVNQNTLDVSQAQLERGKELLTAGSIAQSDYAQLEAQYSSDRYQLVNAQATLKNYKLQLKQLLELEGETEMELKLPQINNENVLSGLPSKTDVYESALLLRPEIQSSKLNMEATQLNVNIAKSGYLPTLSFTAGTGSSHTTGTDFTFGSQVKNGWNNFAGLTLSIPIYNNRETKTAVRIARLESSTSKLNYIDEQKTLFRTIETLWLDATSAQERFIAAQENLRSTQTSYRLVNEQFNLGMKNTVELLTEKNNLLSAQQEMLQAKYMALLNRVLLQFYQSNIIELK